MIPRKGWLRRQLESGLILLAAWILGGRNVTRSPVVSRRDNNQMFETSSSATSPAASASSTKPNPSSYNSSPPTCADKDHCLGELFR